MFAKASLTHDYKWFLEQNFLLYSSRGVGCLQSVSDWLSSPPTACFLALLEICCYKLVGLVA